MIGLDKFLEIFKDPKIVIPTLIAIIIVGGLGGGLWINNLRQTNSESKSLTKQRLLLIEEKHYSEIEILKRRYDVFQYEYERIKRNLSKSNNRIDSSFAKLIILLDSCYLDTIQRKDIDKELSTIKNNYTNYLVRINELSNEVKYSNDRFKSDITKGFPTLSYSNNNRMLVITIIIVCIIVTTIILKRK